MKKQAQKPKSITGRIADLKSEADRLAGGEMTFFESPDSPPEMLEQFWKGVVDFEKATTTTNFAQLAEVGVDLPAPAELDDDELSEKLMAVIAELAKLRVFLVNTDHLSDRELYQRLWEDSLHETVVPDTSPNSTWTIDFVSSGSDEDIELYLKYYADSVARAEWQEMWPGEPIPVHEDRPYDRDRRLPKPARDYQH